MDPHQDGAPSLVQARGPDVEGEAVLAGLHAGGADPAEPGQRELGRGGTRLGGPARALPGLWRLRGLEAQGTPRGARVADPPEAADPPGLRAAQAPVASFDRQPHLLLPAKVEST